MIQFPPLVVLAAVAALALGTALMQFASGPRARLAGLAVLLPAALITMLAMIVRPEGETATASLMGLVAALALGIVGLTAAIAAMAPARRDSVGRWRFRVLGTAIVVGLATLLFVRA